MTRGNGEVVKGRGRRSMLAGGLALAIGVLGVSGMTFGGEPSGADRMRAEVTEEGVWILEDGKRIVFYQRTPRSHEGKFRRAHYLHPVMDLEGRVMTEDFPADHRHHRGIFWSWHQVLVGDVAAGDPWVARDFEWDVRQAEVQFPDDASALLRTVVHWKSPHVTDDAGQPVAFVEEQADLRVHAAGNNHRQLDFEIRLRALRDDVRLGGSDDVKGYGGFCARVRLSPDTRFQGVTGPVQPQVTSVDASPWMNIQHPEYGLAMLAHPSLPDYPPRWILRQQRSMQNPVFPGREPVLLPTDKPLVLRYGLVIHPGTASRSAVEGWHADYVARRPPGDQPPRDAAPATAP